MLQIKEGRQGLRTFPSIEGLPRGDSEVQKALDSPIVSRVKCFALGPLGTNIAQACEEWIDRMAIHYKTSVELCATPEESVAKARAFTKSLPIPECFADCKGIIPYGEVGVFWTCAVYYNLNRIFFENPNVYPFFVTVVMPLDEMQLAVRPETIQQWDGRVLERRKEWQGKMQIAAHPSPSPLVQELLQESALVKANSNAHAAEMCADGQVEMCITTEKARKIYDLVKLHSFGSPDMLFFGGITADGAEIMKRAYQYEITPRARLSDVI